MEAEVVEALESGASEVESEVGLASEVGLIRDYLWSRVIRSNRRWVARNFGFSSWGDLMGFTLVGDRRDVVAKLGRVLDLPPTDDWSDEELRELDRRGRLLWPEIHTPPIPLTGGGEAQRRRRDLE